MSRVSAIEGILDPAGVLERAIGDALSGLVIFDVFGEVRRSFAAALNSTGATAGLGTLRGIRAAAEIECAALAPLAALLGVDPGGLSAGASGPTPGQQVRRMTASLRAALEEHRAGGQVPWLMLGDPQLLDQSSLRILALLAEGGSLRLLIHVRRAWELPRRLKRFLDNGRFGRVPETRFEVERAPGVISAAVGYRVPLVGALALYRMTGGRADQVDLLVQMAPEQDLRRALYTGQMGMIPGSEELSRAIRQEQRDADDELKSLIAAVAVHQHVPLHAAYEQWGRRCVEAAIGGGLLRRHTCGTTPVIMPVSPLIAGHLWNALSAYELAALQDIKLVGKACCAVGEPGMLLSRGAISRGLDPLELIRALEAVSEEPPIGWASPLEAGLKAILPQLDDVLLRRAAVVALARCAYLGRGAHEALRELRANAHDEAMWTDPATVRLVVQICLETGRLQPTARRIAGLMGLPADTDLIELLPPDRVSTLLSRGLKAIEAGDVRAASAHLCVGLRLAAVSNPGPNAAALRVMLLSTAANTLVLGGYREGWQRLAAWMGHHRRAWHARSLPAVELALAVGEINDGELVTGTESLARVSECAGLISAEPIATIAIGVHHGIMTGASATSINGGGEYFLGGWRNHGRKALEESQRAALMRTPEAVLHVMQEAAGFRDPRAVVLRRSAEAQSGLADPLEVAREALAEGQGFQAAWVIDGLLAGMLLGDPRQAQWLARLVAASGDDVLGIVGELMASLGSAGIPGVDAPLAAVLALLPAQSLPVLPFLAHESAVRSLTPREAEVAALAAAGHSNRGIARELTLSVRTIEGHVASVMTKRGFVARDELLGLS